MATRVPSLTGLRLDALRGAPTAFPNPWLAQYRNDVLDAWRKAGGGESLAEDRVRAYEERIAALRKELDDSTTEKAALERALDGTSEELKASEDKKAALERELEDTTKKLAQARQALDILKLEARAARDDEEELRKRSDDRRRVADEQRRLAPKELRDELNEQSKRQF